MSTPRLAKSGSRVCTTEVCAAPGAVYTTEVCSAPGDVYTTGVELHPDMFALQRFVLLLEVSKSQGPELHLNLLHYRSMCCTRRCLHRRGLSCIWRCLQYRGMCCSWRCLHQRGLSCMWTCLRYIRLCCSRRCLQHSFIWMCLIQRNKYYRRCSLCSKIICLMSGVFASLCE